MPVKKRPMTEAEERQWKMIMKALGKNANHPLVAKILVDHADHLPRVGNCGVTREESANYDEGLDPMRRERPEKNEQGNIQ